jgi:carboxyl-terminal processing protease
MKRNSLILGSLFAVLALQAQDPNTSYIRKLQMAEMAIAGLYVDPVDENRLVESAIREMLSQLDPHSVYSDAEEVKKMNEPLQGNFEGIGVQFQMMEDTLLIIQPISDGPSERVGIVAGDRIVAVNDTAIAGVKMSTEEIMSRLRGAKGSKVELTILRRGTRELLSFSVKRDKIPLYSIDASYMIRPNIGYIRIDRFAATTHDEFMNALKELQKSGMEDLILDLQGNGGGYLDAAINLSNEFLEQKELIVYTEGRNAPRQEYAAAGTGRLKQGRLVILIDEFSASASEIVSGAIQDWDRGVLVGRRSFGKGLVQRPVKLFDDSMIRLTVARYYTPAGRCIQKPYERKSSEGKNAFNGYNRDIIDRYNHGELLSADSIHFADSLKVKTKKLQRIVYGGGGIMPDLFVPIDTAKYSDYFRELMAKGVILKVATRYVENNRAALKEQYQAFEDFHRSFEIASDELMNSLKAESEPSKLAWKEEEFQAALPDIKRQLKGFVARDLWDTSHYLQIINENNNSIKSALEILTSNTYQQYLK